jgi:hypothetical protein
MYIRLSKLLNYSDTASSDGFSVGLWKEENNWQKY